MSARREQDMILRGKFQKLVEGVAASTGNAYAIAKVLDEDNPPELGVQLQVVEVKPRQDNIDEFLSMFRAMREGQEVAVKVTAHRFQKDTSLRYKGAVK